MVESHAGVVGDLVVPSREVREPAAGVGQVLEPVGVVGPVLGGLESWPPRTGCRATLAGGTGCGRRRGPRAEDLSVRRAAKLADIARTNRRLYCIAPTCSRNSSGRRCSCAATPASRRSTGGSRGPNTLPHRCVRQASAQESAAAVSRSTGPRSPSPGRGRVGREHPHRAGRDPPAYLRVQDPRSNDRARHARPRRALPRLDLPDGPKHSLRQHDPPGTSQDRWRPARPDPPTLNSPTANGKSSTCATSQPAPTRSRTDGGPKAIRDVRNASSKPCSRAYCAHSIAP
jgi:hypothetical protein